MVIATTSKVVASSDIMDRAIAIQPGNCEWVPLLKESTQLDGRLHYF